MVHKPEHKVHSFRGLLGDGGQDEIRLERQNANVAYRIVKFQIIDDTPGASNTENVVKIYTEEQSSIDGVVNFGDSALLGVAFWVYNHSNPTFSTPQAVIFDNEIFNQDIYVTNKDVAPNATPCNYYIELEEVPVSASALMQLKLGVARKLNLKQ